MSKEDLVLLFEPEDDVAAMILQSMLEEAGVAVMPRPFEDKALDGLVELQEGGLWGQLYVTTEQQELARQVLQDFLDSREEGLDEEAD